MTLRDLSGIFSRYFLTGFFLPALAAVLLVGYLAGADVTPERGRSAGLLGGIVVLFALGVVGGLVLLGLRRPIVRLFEGYPLESVRASFGRDSRLRLPDRARPGFYADRLYHRLVRRHAARRARLARDHSDQARREFDRQFGPADLRLLPTRFGNILRAFEHHADSRWGLSGLTAWPRIAALLSDREREYHLDAETNVMFFLNLCFLSVLAVPVSLAFGRPLGIVGAGPAWAFYRLTLVAAVSWGVEVRASVDLHRLELYQRLGVRMPTSFSDEQATAKVVSQCLEFGMPIPDQFWGPKTWSE